MPEQMEVNLLRARVRELEKANREASFKLRSTPPAAWGNEVARVADLLDDALHSEAKCLDLVEATNLADAAVRRFEVQHSGKIPASARHALVMTIAEAFRGVL